MDNNNRYKFRRKEKLAWEIFDIDTGFSIEFTEGLFNEEQKVCPPSGVGSLDVMDIAKIMREFGDFVATTDLQYLALCDYESRMSLLAVFSWDSELLAEACEALRGIVTPEQSGDYTADEIIDMMLPISDDLLCTLDGLDEAEVQELVRMAFCYHIKPYDYDEWATDCLDFYKKHVANSNN